MDRCNYYYYYYYLGGENYKSLLRWIIYLFQHLFESVLHRNIFSCNYIKYERRGERLFEGYYSTVLAIKSDRVLKIEKSNGIFNW